MQALIQNDSRIDHDTLMRMQAIMLDLMKAFDAVCREHHLTYYLSGGTMLGAVRHKGFIPWDDDADVVMPRRDYEVMLEHAHEWFPEYYELVEPRKNPHYPYQFARLQDNRTNYILVRQFDFVGGVPLDVFPLDEMPPKGLLRRWHFLKISFYTKLLYYGLINPNKHGRGLYSLFIKLMHRLVPLAAVHNRLDAIQKEFEGKGLGYVTNHFNTKDNNVFPQGVYGNPQRVPFESIEVNGMERPVDYLVPSYGDYMQPPKKLPGLNFRFMDLDKPWKEYIEEQKTRNA